MSKIVKIALVIAAAVAAFFLFRKSSGVAMVEKSPTGLEKVIGGTAAVVAIAGKAVATLGSAVGLVGGAGTAVAGTATAGIGTTTLVGTNTAFIGGGGAVTSATPTAGAGAIGAGSVSAVGVGAAAVGMALWIGGAVKALKSLFSSGWWEGTPQEIAERKAWQNATIQADQTCAELNLNIGGGKGVVSDV